jgi:restriction system protein
VALKRPLIQAIHWGTDLLCSTQNRGHVFLEPFHTLKKPKEILAGKRHRPPNGKKLTEAGLKAFSGIALLIFMLAYFNPSFRPTLLTWAKWGVVLVSASVAFWWWHKSRNKNKGQLALRSKHIEPTTQRDLIGEASINQSTPLLSPLDAIHAKNAHQLPLEGNGKMSSPAPGLTLELLHEIEWKRFEELCAAYFGSVGFHSKTQSHGADGGIDIRLSVKGEPGQIRNIVQCKAWTKPVGIKPMREFLGVMVATNALRGTFVALSGFHPDAEAFARTNRIFPIGGKALVDGMLRLPVQEQLHLLSVATEGEYMTPTCASCGIKMIMRKRKADQSEFWGCANYPRCKVVLQPGNALVLAA